MRTLVGRVRAGRVRANAVNFSRGPIARKKQSLLSIGASVARHVLDSGFVSYSVRHGVIPCLDARWRNSTSMGASLLRPHEHSAFLARCGALSLSLRSCHMSWLTL